MSIDTADKHNMESGSKSTLSQPVSIVVDEATSSEPPPQQNIVRASEILRV